MAKKYKRRKSGTEKFLLTIIVITIIIISCIYLYITYQDIEIYEPNYETEKTISTQTNQTVEEIEEKSKEIADVLEETMKSVVGISKLKDNGQSILSGNDEHSLGLGTGIIVLKNGYILSNEHVTGEKLSTCYVTLEDGIRYDGIVMWSDSNLDLSIVKINKENLNSIVIGESSKIRTGETVYAIGNPIGFEFRRTVTSGIISSTNRSIKIDENDESSYMSGLIQTDATINPGNSGGPLIYPNGEVIGINTIKISSAEGIGFAIPIDVVKPVIESFKNTGDFQQATLGIYAYDKNVVPYLNNNVSFNKGIYVVKIIKNGPADNTGLKEGDIILSIDGNNLETMNDLRAYIYRKKPDDVVTLNIARGRINRVIKIKLGKQ